MESARRVWLPGQVTVVRVEKCHCQAAERAAASVEFEPNPAASLPAVIRNRLRVLSCDIHPPNCTDKSCATGMRN